MNIQLSILLHKPYLLKMVHDGGPGGEGGSNILKTVHMAYGWPSTEDIAIYFQTAIYTYRRGCKFTHGSTQPIYTDPK